MLSTETKRHIDNARDILVGVVPVPTSQIEQITNALIYKFMDDMDQSAIKAGGDPTFFVGDLENYSWSRLMSERVGSQERINLYRDALSKFATAKQLPDLFRDIFRAAFLPYNSPEVLDLFLKEISYFDYKHSEELGNAYEYLLSIMGSQGDAGMFRTPRHIIDFVVDVVNPTKDDKVLDPACGTAGFLISAYKHILEQHDSKDDPEKKEIPLTPEQRKRLFNNFEGYDVSPEMVKLSKVNMYLHQFRNPQIFAYNTLTSEERWNDKYDVILANPPFMTARGGVKTHNRFSVKSKQAEVLFVDYIMNHLRPKGRAGIIVPEGIIFKSDTATKQLRKNLVEDGLYAVVSLPSGVFNPYAGVKTSILLFDNARAKEVNELLFVKIENDGYDLGAQRRPISKNDLPEALKVFEAWRNGEKLETTIAQWVPRTKIADSGDYNLSAAKYFEAKDYTNTVWPIVRLADLIEIDFGVRITKKDSRGTLYPVFGGGGESFRTDTHNREFDDVVVARFAMSESCVRRVKGPFFLLDSGFTYHVTNVNVTKEYVDHFLLNQQNLVYACARGHAQKNIDINQFKEIQVPLPPLEVQQQIVAELDGYQKIIDGARQITDNWKPSFVVDPTWPVFKLGEVSSILGGYAFKSEDLVNEKQGDTYKPVVKIGNVGRDGNVQIDDVQYHQFTPQLEKFLIHSGDILVAMTGATVGKVAISKFDDLLLNQRVGLIRPNNEVLLKNFLSSILLSNSFYQYCQNTAGGGAQGNISPSQISSFTIPLPPLEVQRQLVDAIEAERTHVESARALIDLYTQKTQASIAKLWSV